MQPSNVMGNLIKNLWNSFGADGHFSGYRLALHHPEHGMLIAADVEWFVIRRIAFIPKMDMAQISAGQPLPSREMLFHIDQHENWYPIQISDTLSNTSNHVPDTPPDPADQRMLAEHADQWAEMLTVQHWLTNASKFPSDLATTLTTLKHWQPSGDTLQRWLQAIHEVEAADVSLTLLCDACQQVGVSIAR